jgi:hypothetical protein
LGHVQTGIVPEFILFFDVPMDEMERRILGRNQGRVDDNIETLKKRLKVFVESSLPVVKYYDAMGKVHKVNATTSVDDVFETIRPLFKRYEQVTGPIYLPCLLSFIHHIRKVFWGCTGKSTMQRRIGMQYCCPAECFRQPKDCYIQVSVHRRFH